MKALSLRQPWANAVLYLGKHIENRTWWTGFRGEFLIHASKRMTEEEYEQAFYFCEDVVGIDRVCDAVMRPRLKFGGIVGRARLVDVVRPRPSHRLRFTDAEGRSDVEGHYPPSVTRTPDLWRWHMAEQYGFVLEDVSEVPFVPCRGMPGFFDVPEEVHDELVVKGIEGMASAIAWSWWRRYAAHVLSKPFRMPQSMIDNLAAAGLRPDSTDEEIAEAIARRRTP